MQKQQLRQITLSIAALFAIAGNSGGAWALETCPAALPSTNTITSSTLQIASEQQQEANKEDIQTVPEWLEKVEAHLERSDFKKAVAEATKLLQTYPKCAEGYYLRAYANKYGKLTDLPHVKADLDVALALDANYMSALKLRADVTYSQHDWYASQADLLRIISLQPRDEDALRKLISVHGQMNAFETVVQDYTYWITFRTNEPSLYFNRGMIYKQLGKLDLALSDLKMANELFLAQGRTAEATQLQQQIAAIEQNNPAPAG